MVDESNWRAAWGRGQRFAFFCHFAKGKGVSWRLVRMLKHSLLIVDDQKPTRDGLRAALEDRYDVYLADDAKSGLELLEKENFDVLLADLRLPTEDGMKLITQAKAL